MPLEWGGATRVPTPRGDRIGDLSRGTALHQHGTSIELGTRNGPQFRDSSTWDRSFSNFKWSMILPAVVYDTNVYRGLSDGRVDRARGGESARAAAGVRSL